MSDNEIGIRVTSRNDTAAGFDAAKRGSADVASSFDRAGEAADGAERSSRGFSDTLMGTTDAMAGASAIAEGDLVGGLAMVGTGVADLAGGFSDFLLPALKNMTVSSMKARAASIAHATATKVSAAAQWLLNAALTANPIGLVVVAIAALVAAVVIAYKKSETFRNLLNKLWGMVKSVGGALADLGGVLRDKVMAGFTAVIDGIKSLPGRIRDLGGLFKNAGGALIGAFVNGMKNAGGIVSGIAGNVWSAVRGLLNGAIDKINAALEFKINLPGPDISINPPNIPHLARGGIAGGLAVVGERGRELVRLPYGSQVYPNGAAERMLGRGGGHLGTLEVVVKTEDGREIQRKLLALQSTGGALGFV